MTTSIPELVFALIAAVTSFGSSGPVLASSSNDASASCEIQASASGKMLEIEAVLHAATAVQGTYTLSIDKVGAAGSASIDQGGDFAAAAGESLTLGSALVGSKGASFDVTLKIAAPGSNLTCEQRIASPS